VSQHAIKRFHRSEDIALLFDILWPVGPLYCGTFVWLNTAKSTSKYMNGCQLKVDRTSCHCSGASCCSGGPGKCQCRTMEGPNVWNEAQRREALERRGGEIWRGAPRPLPSMGLCGSCPQKIFQNKSTLELHILMHFCTVAAQAQ